MTRTSHGHRTPHKTPTYISWQHMKDRCYNKRSDCYPDYGGRGIRVCRGWYTSFAKFLRDMGERPHGTSLDRIDPNGHYTPDNCRWATTTQQNRNQRRHKRTLPRRGHAEAQARV